MTVKPLNETIVCKTREKIYPNSHGFAIPFQNEFIELYDVIEVNSKSSIFKVGDVVICNSTGTQMKDEKLGIDCKVFSLENVACKVEV